MKYPKLREIPTAREMIDVFRGYNHNLRIADGEFYDMKNLSSDHYPVLSTRQRRGIYATTDTPQGMIAKKELCYVDGEDFVIDGTRIPMGLTRDNTPKQLVSMGAYVIIMPDKKYINTINYEDRGDIEKTVVKYGPTYTLCQKDGSPYENLHIGASAPADPEENAYWLNTAESPPVLKNFLVDHRWGTVVTTYVKIFCDGIGLSFYTGDRIEISGIESELKHLNSITTVIARDDNYIIIPAILQYESFGDPEPICITKRMPKMDFIIESGNRLWGCRYGPAINGEMVNEIYASKLGDFKNWGCFSGTSTDSYVVGVGTDGPFTGAVTFKGMPLFLKENAIHTVYGDYPANFHIQTTPCRGVQLGCEKSLAIVNEVLYYKARAGICAYDGSLPVEVSAALGDVVYKNAVAGSLANTYYISMQDESEQWYLFSFDTRKNLWYKDDDTQAVDFCSFLGDLYFIDYADKQIKTIRGTGIADQTPIRWYAITGILGTDSPDKKYISRIDVRMSLEIGSRVTFFVEYDSSGEWKHLFSMDGVKLQSFPIPIRAQRCDHLRLKVVGTGGAKIFSICKTIEQGSDA